jgi:alpha-1,2-mannosyltransferase
VRSKQIGVVVALAVIAAAAHLWYGNRHHFFDLLIYRDAMTWWDSGHRLYDFWKPDATQGRLEFTYPPFAAYLLRPLAWMSTGEAIGAFTVVAVAAFALSVFWLVRPFGLRAERGRQVDGPVARRHNIPVWFAFAVAFILATGLEPIREAFTFGQINFVLWALILFDLLVLWPRGSRWTGVGIGLATAIKLVPGIFIVYLLVTRRWRAAVTAVLATVAATGIAAILSPSDSWTFFTTRVLHGEGVGQLHYTFNQSITGVLARLAYPGQPSTLAALLLALPVLGYGLWRAGRAAAAGDEVTGLTLTGFVGSLVSPLTWAHHIFWFVPALVVLVDVYLDRRDRRSLSLAVVVYLTVTFSVLSLWDFTLHQPGGVLEFVMSNWLVWLMLGLLVALPIRSLTPQTDARRSAQPEPALARDEPAAGGEDSAPAH